MVNDKKRLRRKKKLNIDTKLKCHSDNRVTYNMLHIVEKYLVRTYHTSVSTVKKSVGSVLYKSSSPCKAAKLRELDTCCVSGRRRAADTPVCV